MAAPSLNYGQARDRRPVTLVPTGQSAAALVRASETGVGRARSRCQCRGYGAWERSSGMNFSHRGYTTTVTPTADLTPDPATQVLSTSEATCATLVGDRYELGAIIGRGGMSTVYEALDRHTSRRVAVKVFRPGIELADSPARRLREVQLASAVRHSGLVAVLDAQLDDTDRVGGGAFLVTELIDGPTLGQRLRSSPLSEREVIGLATALCSALAAIHEVGIVHRDIKPANVLLPDGEDGLLHPKLTDFGIALMIDSTRMTATGFTAGTANYLSPEQVLSQPVAAASDIYSLGLVLMEALSGETVYAGHGIEAALARLNVEPRPPAWVSPALAETLMQMTASDPEKRPTAETARRTFRRLAGDGLASDVFALDAAAPSARRDRSSLLATRGRRAIAIAATFVAAAAVALGLILSTAGHSDHGTAANTDPRPSSATSSPTPARGGAALTPAPSGIPTQRPSTNITPIIGAQANPPAAAPSNKPSAVVANLAVKTQPIGPAQQGPSKAPKPPNNLPNPPPKK
jgi:serine/threonine protein kinase